MTLPANEFIRRFLLPVLPDGFHRIRHSGLFASATRAATIARIRALLAPRPAPCQADPEPDDAAAPAGPCCGGCFIIIERFQRGGSPQMRPTVAVRINTS